MKKVILTAAALLSLTVSFAQPAVSTKDRPAKYQYVQRYVDAVTSSKDNKSSSFGVLAVTIGGDTVAAKNPLVKLLPASSAKLISTGLSMNEFGSDYKIKTSIGYTGKIEEGTLKGDVYIIGGGDPTIGSADSIATPTDKLFAQWMKILSDAGIKNIEGMIIGDGRYFEGYTEHPSWCYEDIGTYYGTGGNALCFYRNVVDVKVKAGAKVGDRVEVTPSYPSMPWMTWNATCTTGAKGTGDQLFLYVTDVAPVAEMKGTFAVDRYPKTEECSNKWGAYTCAYYFCDFLSKHGVGVSGGPADIDGNGYIRTDLKSGKSSVKASDKITVIGNTLSPSLKRISYITNHRSDNFYADALIRLVAKKHTGSAAYSSIPEAVGKACKNIGVDAGYGIQVVDGSGLSRMDYISPDFFCRYMGGMLRKGKCFKDFYWTLGYPGEPSSYPYRMQGEQTSLKKRIHLKSGAMGGVRTFCGYIDPEKGTYEDTIVFSVMVNNFDGSSATLMSQIDKIIALMAGAN